MVVADRGVKVIGDGVCPDATAGRYAIQSSAISRGVQSGLTAAPQHETMAVIANRIAFATG